MALTAENVTRQFLRKRSTSNVFNAVDGVSVTLENGKVTVITGPSGSGKSTLLHMMAGILTPTGGTIKVEGADLYGMSDGERSAFRNLNIGMIPQGQTPVYALNVLDNVLLPYMIYRHKKRGAADTSGRKIPDEEAMQKRAEELLERTGIRDLEHVMPSEMSGGEQRRMAIVRAMLMQPDVILADEPTADLDEENTKIVLSLMKYAAQEGSSVLIVTHDSDVFPWADVILHMKDGKILTE